MIPGKASSEPTSGPTFESISPKESSRNKKKIVDPAARTSTLATSTRTAAPTASGERSLIRALGLKIGKIVVDAGHGGHDTGTIGPNGLEEKDLVLDVALKLGKLLEDGWALRSFTRATTTRSFRWRRGRPSPIKSRPICLSPFMRTPRAMLLRAA